MNKKYYTYLLLISLLIICSLLIIKTHIFLKKNVLFPPILYINLDTRKDRMLEITKEFSKWPVPPERVSAVKYSPGWKGCSASHLKCVTIAKERKYPWVLIVEDDCVLSSTALEKFKALLPFLWNYKDDWDIFYGGTTFIKYGIRKSYDPPLFQVSGYATHFCLIHNSSYNKILDNHPRHIDDFKIPIDVYYSNKLRIWTTTPFIAKQRPSISDIVLTTNGDAAYADYDSESNKAETLLTNMIF
jgi:hypothetical protein